SFSGTLRPAQRNAMRISTLTRCATRAIGSARTLPLRWANSESRAERYAIERAGHGHGISSGTAKAPRFGAPPRGEWSAARRAGNDTVGFLRERSTPQKIP